MNYGSNTQTNSSRYYLSNWRIVFIAAWDLGLEGGLIGILGGLTEDSLNDKQILERIRGPEGPHGIQGSSADIPIGAVVAFEHPKGCPAGWEKFEKSSGRFLIGVGTDDSGNEYKLPYINGKPEHLTGGNPVHQITLNQLPKHTHDVIDEGHTHIALAANHNTGSSKSQGFPNHNNHNRFKTTDRYKGNNNRPVNESAIQKADTGIRLDVAGDNNPIGILPPYIALNFCKRYRLNYEDIVVNDSREMAELATYE